MSREGEGEGGETVSPGQGRRASKRSSCQQRAGLEIEQQKKIAGLLGARAAYSDAGAEAKAGWQWQRQWQAAADSGAEELELGGWRWYRRIGWRLMRDAMYLSQAKVCDNRRLSLLECAAMRCSALLLLVLVLLVAPVAHAQTLGRSRVRRTKAATVSDI